MYVPFWLFDANASGSGQYEATTSSSHRNGDYVITTTRHYDVRRAGTTQFMGVPVDGSTKMPNGHMDAIEPYDYRAFQPFSTAFLPGYMADNMMRMSKPAKAAPTPYGKLCAQRAFGQHYRLRQRKHLGRGYQH